MWLHREKYFHLNTQRALLDVLSRSSEMEKKAKVLDGILQRVTHLPPSFCGYLGHLQPVTDKFLVSKSSVLATFVSLTQVRIIWEEEP